MESSSLGSAKFAGKFWISAKLLELPEHCCPNFSWSYVWSRHHSVQKICHIKAGGIGFERLGLKDLHERNVNLSNDVGNAAQMRFSISSVSKTPGILRSSWDERRSINWCWKRSPELNRHEYCLSRDLRITIRLIKDHNNWWLLEKMWKCRCGCCGWKTYRKVWGWRKGMYYDLFSKADVY